MRVLPERVPYSGKYWSFTSDGKEFFSLGLYHQDAHHWELLDAYRRHRKRRPAGINVEFVYRDEMNKGQKSIERQSMDDLIEYENLQRELHEDAARQDDEARRNAEALSDRPPWSR